MATPNFESILDTPGQFIKERLPLPVGTYHVITIGQPRFDKSSKKGTDFVEFTLKFLAALDDVDEDDLKAALTKPDESTERLQDRTIRYTFYYESQGPRLKKFLEHLGFDMDEMTPRQALSESPNREVNISLRHKPTDDGRIFAEIASSAPIE